MQDLDASDDEDIADKYAAVLVGIFHLMDRIKVPVRHEYKRQYVCALCDASFKFDPDILGQNWYASDMH
jgi:hypothetical protein